MAEVTMPQLGETVTEGTITKWFKQVGDRVEADEVLFEVSTDKVDSEVTAPASGFVAEIRVVEGTTVDVGVVLAVISTEASAASASPPPVAEPPVAAPAPAPAPVAETPPPPPPAPVVETPPVVAPPPPAPVAAPEVAPTAPTSPTPTVSSVEAMDRVLSPVVRKLINENGLDPAAIIGTGIGGRITREDVQAFLEARAARPVAPQETPVLAPAMSSSPTPPPTFSAPPPTFSTAPPPAAPVAAPAPPAQPAPQVAAVAQPEPAAVPAPPAPPAAPAAVAAPVAPSAPPTLPAPPVPAVAPPSAPAAPGAGLALRAGARDHVVALNNIRRRTGEHMVMSLATAPHAFIAVEVDYTTVDKVRGARKESFKSEEGFSLTYMPFVARAVVEAMVKFPNVNASVDGSSLVVHGAVNLGIAVDLDFQGLMVPVLKDADGKRMRAIARDISDLASRARGKRLTPDDISGGTFTLSNAGPYGIDLMQSIINQPQVAILSITSVTKKPVVQTLPDGTDVIAIRPMGTLGLSWDHRAFDGAYAASFLSEIKHQLQSRDWASEL